jgi:hypothetical protein
MSRARSGTPRSKRDRRTAYFAEYRSVRGSFFFEMTHREALAADHAQDDGL